MDVRNSSESVDDIQIDNKPEVQVSAKPKNVRMASTSEEIHNMPYFHQNKQQFSCDSDEDVAWGTANINSAEGASQNIDSDCRVGCSPEDGDEPTTSLVLSRIECLPVKDFSSEVRAKLDIEMFVKEGTILINPVGSTLDDILEVTLEAIFSSPTRQVIPPPGWDNDLQPETVDGQSMENQSPPKSTTSITSSANVKWLHIGALSPGSEKPSGDDKLNSTELVQEAKRSLLTQIKTGDHSYQRFAKTIKGISTLGDGEFSTDQTWICAMSSMNGINKCRLAIAKLSNPVNLGRSNEGICLVALVLTPTKEKETKSDVEVGRTFATLLSDSEFRAELLHTDSEQEFRQLLCSRARELTNEQLSYRRRSSNLSQLVHIDEKISFGQGICADLRRRLPLYLSDFTEGTTDKNGIRKLVSATLFLYFACLLPSMAFGMLNYRNTGGKINVKGIMIAQTFSGICNALFGGQPLIVVLSTAPLALYIKIIYSISEAYEINFEALYATVGLFNSLILIVFSVFGFSSWMRWSTRSTEEVFSLFVSVAFLVDAGKDCYKTFYQNFACGNETWTPESIVSANSSTVERVCKRDVALLYLLLLLCTVWLGLYLYNFTKTPYLTTVKREILTDFALPIAVLAISIIGSLAFQDINRVSVKPFGPDVQIHPARIELLSWQAALGAFGLAIPLSLLSYMEQNIVSAVINSPANKSASSVV